MQGHPTIAGARSASHRPLPAPARVLAGASEPAQPRAAGSLAGPTLIAFGSSGQQRRFLPAIASVTEQWCLRFSEPGAGSDLASVTTAGRLAGDHWLINGQKIWTSLAHVADWCFVLARTEPGSRRAAGLSMRYLLGVERGVATVGQQIQFRREPDEVIAAASKHGADADPVLRDRIAQAHRALGQLAVDVQRPPTMLARGEGYELDAWQRLHLFSRADTIYGGSDEIQLGVIASRALGPRREPAPGQDRA
jgi:alkylation response protein AidB-like acyl-CoA dehydrogenase